MRELIVTNEKLVSARAENKVTREAKIVFGDPREVKKNTALQYSDGIDFTVTSKDWKNSKERFELYRNMHALSSKMQIDIQQNSSPLPADLMTYLEYAYIDLQRLADMKADYTDMIYNVKAMPDATDPTKIRSLIPYVGEEHVISGENDTIPLIEEYNATGDTVDLDIKAFGHKTSLRNMIFNPNETLQRILEAAATILVDSRNNDVIGKFVSVGASSGFKAKQSQGADSTGTTFDQKLYNTYKKALKTLALCTHPLTGQVLGNLGSMNGGARLICNPVDAWDAERVINGQLMLAGGVAANFTKLSIDSIIPYGGGIMNGMKYGAKTLALPGVTKGKAYMYLPNSLSGFVVDKVGQTMQMSQGSALNLSVDAPERGWYRINGVHHDYMLGDALTGANNGIGCVVEITLPTE
jgi:hypothetical protein